MARITIDDKNIEAREGMTVLQVARKNGIAIPTLCDHPDLTPYGGCRLCVVEIAGYRLPQTACTIPISDGMKIQTATPALIAARKLVLQMLLSTYSDAGYTPADRPDTEFAYWLKHYNVHLPDGVRAAPTYAVNADPNPFVWVDMNKCILCARCVRACAEVQGRFVWGLAERGFETRVVAGGDSTMLDARCESCGACAAYCPTGALDDKMSISAGKPDRLVSTICSYCGVGCQIDLNIRDNKIVRVTASPKAPVHPRSADASVSCAPTVNGMALCVKGRYGWDYVHHPDRLTRPRVRRYLLDNTPRVNGRGEWVEVDWDTALNITARKLRDARDAHGPDSVGVLTSAKCTNEENYLMNKFARQVIGTNNIDHCARL